MDDGHWNLKVVRFELNIPPLYADQLQPAKKHIVNKTLVELAKNPNERRKKKEFRKFPSPPRVIVGEKTATTSTLLQELLSELYGGPGIQDRCSSSISLSSAVSNSIDQSFYLDRQHLNTLGTVDLSALQARFSLRVLRAGAALARRLRARDQLRRTQRRLCAVVSTLLMAANGARDVRFAVSVGGAAGGASGANGAGGDFAQWLHAMRLVARMPAGVPAEFRRKLWLTLATRHLEVRGVRWPAAERACFSDTTNPDDAELAVQIVKDLHRTGCSLFCGVEGRENQAMLRRVLLAYARWNKEVGYCQGFNMLAAIILEVMDRNESDSLKVMIYLVEGVLPPGYFADELRGLSADMAAFRDLLRARLPRLHAHLERLQHKAQGDSKSVAGGSYEPPLPDVFTMQWFLTLYATWLPRSALLRVWDLAMLDGGDVLLTTALVIWEMLQDRILRTRSADEFYCAMGAVAAGGAAAGALDTDLLATRVAAARADDDAVRRARERRRYDVVPFAAQMQSAAKKGLRLFYSDDEGDSSDEANKMALTSTFVMPAMERARDNTSGSGASERLSLDIGALKRQYARLRERQRQAHVILAAACARHAAVGVPTTPSPLSVNHLLLGKSAIVSNRGRRLGPPPGTVPPIRAAQTPRHVTRATAERQPAEASRGKSAGNKSAASREDTMNWNDEQRRKSLNRRDSIKWKDIKQLIDKPKKRKGSFEFGESGDGTIVTEIEAREMMTAIRPRTKSESSSYSDCSGSSTSTSLCDEPNRMSDFDSESGSFNDFPERQEILECKKDGNSDKSNVCNIVSYVQGFEELLDRTKEVNTKQSKNIQALIDKTLDEINFKDKLPVDPVGEFVESTPGAPLRDYINEFKSVGEFATKKVLSADEYYYHHSHPFVISAEHVTDQYGSSVSSSWRDTNYSSKSDGDILISTKVLPRDKYKDPPNFSYFTDVSPASPSLKISSYHRDVLSCNEKISYVLDESLYESQTTDIIESLIMSPNFIPDIKLSDKHLSDIDEHLRSISPESIAISEDEPPIPLKIDKYFEHSPEFFGARKSGPDISSDEEEEPERSLTKKRQSRQPKKPNSLLLKSNHNDQQSSQDPKKQINVSSIAKTISSKKQNSSIICDREGSHHSLPDSVDSKSNDAFKIIGPEKTHSLVASSRKNDIITDDTSFSDPQSSRRNSERALLIIQENSKILNRILTKQIACSIKPANEKKIEIKCEKSTIEIRHKPDDMPESTAANLLRNSIERERSQLETSTLKGSVSDTLIKEKLQSMSDNKQSRNRPLSLDDKSPIFAHFIGPDKKKESENCEANDSKTNVQTNKTDLYGWENKAFVAKRDYDKTEKQLFEKDVLEKSLIEISNKNAENFRKYSFFTDISLPNKSIDFDSEDITDISKVLSKSEYSRIHSMDIKKGATSHSATLERTNDFHPKTSASLSKYDDRHISSMSDSRYKVSEGISKSLDIPSKAESSQLSDFAFVVTSSISFSYEPSTDDTPSTTGKSNSSDTLCQITSLDQISTPISPKIFPSQGGPKDSYIPAFPASPLKAKEIIGELEKLKMSSDSTSNAITYMTDTETMSSYSLKTPTSPSSSALTTNAISPDKPFNPFPTRGSFRQPNELGIRLGMYARDPLKSPSK